MKQLKSFPVSKPDSSKKSIYKSVTWPAVHIGFVGTLVYFFEKLITGEAHWEYAGTFALIYTLCEMVGFFLHERAWAKYGKNIK
jgi:uncharacterized membrane protein